MSVKSIVIGLALFCLQSGLRSQCPDHDVLIVTQAQVDNFQFNNPNCTEFNKTLELKGPGINNLQGLAVLTKVNILTIDGTQMMDLEGLQNVTISNKITISNNPVLVDISAIEQTSKLSYPANTFMVFKVTNNDALIDLAGLSFDTIGYFDIEGNDALSSLNGLDSLTFVKYRLSINGNPLLRDLTGLHNLTQSDNGLFISNNDRIKNLDGLGNLMGAGNQFGIIGNDSLQSLAGLPNFMVGDPDHFGLNISGNHQLDSCHTGSMCEYIAEGNNVTFSGNAQGCNSRDEVRELCMSVSVDQPGSESDINVYPNPTHGLVFVDYADAVHLDYLAVYNSFGIEVLRINQHFGPIDITHLPGGLYILKFSLNGSIKLATVLKQ